jgi:tetratricopeptide (TPR) repeat protein
MERYLERVRENPESAAAHYNLGLAYTQRGRPDRAEKHYRKALELEPDLVEAWVNLGGVLLFKWDFPGCVAANEEALKRQDDLLLAHYNIGQACLYLADTEGVLRSFRRVVDLDPGHAAGHYFLAVGLLAAGRVPEAVEEMARAKALGHSPAPEFLRALKTAAKELIRSTDPSPDYS